ncbi:MAG: MBL fold metallo-hydrolase [Sandaracinus sp.]|nr:MBL fold metallo-hydrolase [Sandaracinus sp.]
MRPSDLRFSSRAFDVPTSRAPIRVTWLGTAGFAIEHEGTTILIDPYVTRVSLPTAIARPLASDVSLARRFAPKADAIVTGHTHFDHVLDVPTIAKLTGATVYGSRSCTHLCRAEGVAEERVVDVETTMRGEPVRAQVGPFELRFVPSVHSAFALGRIPFPGDIADCADVPLRTHHYKCGAVFGVELRVAGKRLYHLGSADLLDVKVPRDVDLLLMCVAGWTTTPRFTSRVMQAFTPDAVLLSHWDDFFSPMDAGAKMLPAMQLPRLVEELTREDPSVKLGALPLLGSVCL